MDWTIETTKGCFQGNRLKEVINDMIEYYGSNDEDPEQVTDAYAYGKDDRLFQICAKGISKIQERIEEEVAEWRRVADEEWRGQKDIESDYYRNLL